ncbi:MAG: hypothetical protein LBH96_03675 [Candidatus Peribacteria bacterium]|jgi:hypothetical protein|nr:hypothetical protein [Candidatus Peribacteria bacterium]
MPISFPITPEYQNFLETLKQQILRARHTAVRSVNSQLIALYYEIGKMIVVKQEETKR